jgi:2Fe-2S type ferredoxin
VAGSLRLALTKSGRTIEVGPSQTLLDAAEAAGVDIPTLCRAGVCGTCRTRVASGDVQCTSDSLDDRDREAGFVLPCVTWAQSDCALEA